MPKNFRQIPQLIIARLAELGNIPFRVGVVKRIPNPEIVAGNWTHVGIAASGGAVTFNSPILPNAGNGRTSSFNSLGKTMIRKDLPKEIRSIDLGERPIYGDWSNGGFDLTVNRECYRRDDIPAPRVAIESRSIVTEETGFGVTVVYICTSRAHQAGSPSFERNLLHDLNLLQENIGNVDIIDAAATDDELLRRIYVNWEILPPGDRDATLAAILNIYRARNDDERRVIQERYQVLAQYEPDRWIVGQHQFSGYFGIIRGNDVVLENVRYGNALYRMDVTEWEELSQHSRTNLLTHHSDHVQRVVHTPGWQGRLAHLLEH
jgi:hypothetical protein